MSYLIRTVCDPGTSDNNRKDISRYQRVQWLHDSLDLSDVRSMHRLHALAEVVIRIRIWNHFVQLFPLALSFYKDSSEMPCILHSYINFYILENS